jgi:hypothetical protein
LFGNTHPNGSQETFSRCHSIAVISPTLITFLKVISIIRFYLNHARKVVRMVANSKAVDEKKLFRLGKIEFFSTQKPL